MNGGYSNGARGLGSDAWKGSEGARDETHSVEPLPHIDDIISLATQKVDELRACPIPHLLREARSSFNAARLMMQGRKGQDRAYRDYLIAFELAVEAIPRSRDFVDRIQTSRGDLNRDYMLLVKEIHAYELQFENIKNIIVNDNRRNGTRSRCRASSSRPSSSNGAQQSRYTPATYTHEHRHSNGATVRYRDDELMLPDPPTTAPNGGVSSAKIQDPSPRKPLVHSKPQSLHSRAVHSTTNGYGDDLAERFARLRPTSTPVDTRNFTPDTDYSVKMPSPSDYHSSSRSLGPRDLPPPLQPPKLPLITNLPPSMPKAPSPTYSPARNLSSPLGINPPRSTARSMVGTGGRSNSQSHLAASGSTQPSYRNGATDSYFPNSTHAGTSRRKSLHKPQEFQITAEKLYDYIRLYDVLLIDVRGREEFDSGHIFVRSIVCIEPTALDDGCSAEQLQDRLVLSPDEEQAMFERRHEYDLVVYYDESTKTNAFLDKHNRNDREMALKRLFDTLYEFNAEKPLQQAPIFLMGGLNAWVSLMGPQALKTSSTATLGHAGRTKPTRPIGRVSAASHASKLSLQKRRIREYAPMDPEEERQFLEEARQGRAVFEQPSMDEEDDEPTSPIYRSTEEFLRRYPEVDMGQQSMVYPPARPQIPGHTIAPTIPSAPSRPPPSVPRVSYSGVHERQIAPHGRTTLSPAYVSPGRHGLLRLPKTGLVNFGATCYMNSIIQCLSGTIQLSHIFLGTKFREDIQKGTWKGSRGVMPETYSTLLSNLWKGDVAAVRPMSFKKLCARLNSQWGTDQQQDANEFFEFVIDTLHEDLNVTYSNKPLRDLTTADEQARERLPRPYVAKVEWERYTHREKSIINDLFQGQYSSRLFCTTCGTTSTTYEPFWSLSVEIPHDRPGDLRDCLRSYCSEERLLGEDEWRCPKCKVDREATKKITITRAPDLLVISFKRFSASRTQQSRKVHTPIEFPLHGLDLGPFMEPPLTPVQEQHIKATARDGTAQLVGLKTDPSMNGPYIYNAYAVVRHLGSTLGSGHYIALVKDKARGVWRQYNDERVVDFEPGNLPASDRLQNEKAYIVFYERERVAGGAF
ncbi:cysteine proteinase [Delitschia confertaspora ATCC 74209]|uniref:Cysteine proteinase n=1 Tax=Delitschia confertaspora ATCC 74209 TaxID=1513339 RepID=A0A9P4MQK7_9PLEO|nr:cysteine proteinase [Delitschia confertaspora ATCC 74209]